MNVAYGKLATRMIQKIFPDFLLIKDLQNTKFAKSYARETLKKTEKSSAGDIATILLCFTSQV